MNQTGNKGKVILIRYGEIALKGKYVRRMLVRALIDNIKTHFSTHNLECFITSDYGRVYLYCDDFSSAMKILRRVFGIVSFSVCTETSSGLSQILEETKRLSKEWLGEGMKFAVRTRRVGTHPYTSQSLAKEIGSEILSTGEKLRVDLDNPDFEVWVEVRHDKTYIFRDSVSGPGGLPMGTQGIVLAFFEEEDDIMAAWLMMRRGCKVHVAYTNENSGFETLKILDPKISFYKCKDLNELLKLCDELNAEGIALGWDVDKALKTKLKYNVPIFYPLIGLGDTEKEELMKTILGSYEHANSKPH